MIAALPNADDAPPGLDLYVGDERRTTITTNFGTATEALAAAVLLHAPFRYQRDGRAIALSGNDSDFGRADLTMN